MAKKDNIGGPLLGASYRAIRKAAEGPTQAGADAIRDLGERNRGRAAHRASRSGGFLMQLMGGRRLPTRRAEAELVQRGNDWAKAENQLAAALVRRRHDAAYRRGGPRGQVVAGKEALVEIAGSDGNRDSARRASEQAIIQLLGSNSWIEVQSSTIPQGRNQGKRITKTRAWQDTLADPENTQLWVETAKKRPDLTPDVIQAAQRTAGYEYDEVPASQAALLDDLDHLCLTEAISRLDIASLSGLHEGIFEEIGRLNDPVLSQQLFDVLRSIAHTGRFGRDALSSLHGPRSHSVDAALAPIHETYASI